MSLITKALGKRSQSGHWVLAPPKSQKKTSRLIAEAQTQVSPVYVRLRDDIGAINGRPRKSLDFYLGQLRQHDAVELPVEKVFDEVTGRMRHTCAVIKRGEVLPLGNANHACTLLHPDKFGYLIEECNATGRPCYGTTSPDEPRSALEPPKPAAAKQAELDRIKAERDELLARLEALESAKAAPPKPKKGKSKASKKQAAEAAPDKE